MSDINLILPKNQESLKREKRIKLFNSIALVCLIIIGLTSIIIFLLIQSLNIPSIKQQQGDVLKQMSQFQSKQAKLLVLSDRINNIQNILDKRKDLSSVTNIILERMPNQLSIDSLEMDEKTISITASSTSLFSIGEFINNLTGMVKNKEFITSLTLDSLVFDDSKNSYQVSVSSDL